MMENQRKMINDCPLNVPNDGVVATPDDLNGYFSVCADQKDFCTCSPFDVQGNFNQCHGYYGYVDRAVINCRQHQLG